MTAVDPSSALPPRAATAVPVVLPSSKPPAMIGPYRVDGILGRGGMGVVYRATAVVSCEVPIGQEVAIKLLRSGAREEQARFAREAAYLQRLRHPNIVRVFDAGEYDGLPYIVMQLVSGRHGDALVAGGKAVDQRQAAEIAAQALDALVAAHRQGILHRDIKPGNLILGDDGVVRLLDFGLAHLMVMESGLTASGAVVGTPAYMSPEQACGQRELVGPRSDVYGMGACLYELLTGKPPYDADNPIAVLHLVANAPFVLPSRQRADLDPQLETIVLRAMERDPRERYGSAEQMAKDLRRWLRGERIHTRRPAAHTRILRNLWRERRSFATVGLGLFIFLAVVALLVDAALHRKVPSEPTSAALKTPEPTAPQPQDWIQAWDHRDPLSTTEKNLKFRTLPGKERDTTFVVLPVTVSGNTRLSASTTSGPGEGRIELLVSDRDPGSGYRLRLQWSKDGLSLALWRNRRQVALQDLPKELLNQPVKLTLERFNNNIVGTFNGQYPVAYELLEPVDRVSGNNAGIATWGAVSVSQIMLERQRGNLQVSALAEGDAYFVQNDNYLTAKDTYTNFINDHPQSPLVRDAELRIALCDVGLNDFQSAYDRCDRLITDNREDVRFVNQATYVSFLCALQLKRYQEASSFLASLSRTYDLANLLFPAPALDRVQALLDFLLKRGETTAVDLPSGAIDCFAQAESIANALHRPVVVRQARHWRGDLLRSEGRLDEALDAYHAISDEASESDEERAWANLKVAATLRLANRSDEALSLYRSILQQGEKLPSEPLQNSRLWLGDLLAEQNRVAEAYDTWRTSSENDSNPGRIMAALVAGRDPELPAKSLGYGNDRLYFIARRMSLIGDNDAALERLQESLTRNPPWDWPSPLTRMWISHLEQFNVGPGIPMNEEHPQAQP